VINPSIAITVANTPSPKTAVVTDCCQYDDSFTLTVSPLGGRFFGNGVVQSVFSPANAKIGPNVVTYNVTYPTGCHSSINFTINVHEPGSQNCLLTPSILQKIKDKIDDVKKDLQEIQNAKDDQNDKDNIMDLSNIGVTPENYLVLIAIIGTALVLVAFIIIVVLRSRRLKRLKNLNAKNSDSDIELDSEEKSKKNDRSYKPVLSRALSKQLVREASRIVLRRTNNVVDVEVDVEVDSEEQKSESENISDNSEKNNRRRRKKDSENNSSEKKDSENNSSEKKDSENSSV